MLVCINLILQIYCNMLKIVTLTQTQQLLLRFLHRGSSLAPYYLEFIQILCANPLSLICSTMLMTVLYMLLVSPLSLLVW